MVGEARGTYIFVDGEWKPGVTVKGSKGEKGDPGQGLPGVPGEAALGVHVGDEPPLNPEPWETVWLDTGGSVEVAAFRTIGANGEPSFLNNWVARASFQPPQFYKTEGGWVVLRGTIGSGTVGAAAFTLPVGYRPAVEEAFAIATHNGSVWVAGVANVLPSGNVNVSVGGNNVTSLAGIRFLAGV